MEQRAITQRGKLTEIDVRPVFTSVTENSTWIIASSDIKPEFYRVISIVESDDGSYTITASDYNPSKFEHIENGNELIEYDTTNNTLDTGVKNVVITDEIYRGLGEVSKPKLL